MQDLIQTINNSNNDYYINKMNIILQDFENEKITFYQAKNMLEKIEDEIFEKQLLKF